MYITEDDLKKRFGDTLYTVAGYNDQGNTDTNKIHVAIADACSEVDGYLRERYNIPLNPVPAVIKRLACTIAMDIMASSGDTANEVVQNQAKNARKSLTEIAKGVIKLGVADKITPTIQTDGDVQYDAPPAGKRGIYL